jgi:hypothetical protein
VLRSVSVFRVASVFRGAFVLGIASVQRSASAVVSWLDGYLEKKEVDIAAPYYHGRMGCFEKWEMDIPAPRRMIGHGIFGRRKLDFLAMTEMELRYGLQGPTSAGFG